MNNKRIFVLSFLVLLTACKRPPDAPKRLDKLCGYLFAHTWDEQTTALQAGLNNLADWLEDHTAATEEGYTIQQLSQPQVDKLDSCDRNIKGLLGAAVSTRSSFEVDDIAWVIVDVPSNKVYRDTEINKRFGYSADKQCFIDHDCDRLRYETASEQTFALGLEVRSLNTQQHRWVETKHGPAHVYRTWLQQPAEVNWDWLDVQAQFFVSATIPWEGGTARLQATWAVTEFGGGHVPEATALNKAIQAMQETDEDVQLYLKNR